jgi:hypothetical protein
MHHVERFRTMGERCFAAAIALIFGAGVTPREANRRLRGYEVLRLSRNENVVPCPTVLVT